MGPSQIASADPQSNVSPCTMAYRQLGRSGLEVSVIGMGTNQLRLVSERQAVETLLRGFDLGINIVHTAPDYEGAEELVARAVKTATDKHVIVASQGYDLHGNKHGPVSHFERLFEATCERLGTGRLELYGIACIDDREAYQENVWGTRGMVEFLLSKQQEGRVGTLFCTTHGSPAYLRQLIERNVFGALMVAYNPLGYHLLSWAPDAGQAAECLPRAPYELFPRCEQRGVGLMIMKPFAGGILTSSGALPARRPPGWSSTDVTAEDVLQSILAHSAVSCIIPGTASVSEAEQNARAGFIPIHPHSEVRQQNLARHVLELQTTVCSRCGQCDSLCSQQLPISWLFRAAYGALYPSVSFETPPAREYFALHPALTATCATCPDVTCVCPYGVDIPTSLSGLHRAVTELAETATLRRPTDRGRVSIMDPTFCARLVWSDVPSKVSPGQTSLCRVFVENTGTRAWLCQDTSHKARVALAVWVDAQPQHSVRLRHDVQPSERCHFAFDLVTPRGEGSFNLRLAVLGEHLGYLEDGGIELFAGAVQRHSKVDASAAGVTAWLAQRLRRLLARWRRVNLTGAER